MSVLLSARRVPSRLNLKLPLIVERLVSMEWGKSNKCHSNCNKITLMTCSIKVLNSVNSPLNMMSS